MGTKIILVIEDTKSIQEEIHDILTFEGLNVITANDGQEGIDLAIKEKPDLILCDIMMPIKDGFDVYSELQYGDLRNTPFIFLTAKATTENIREGMILGADDYITKPFDLDLLVNSIKSRLAKDSHRRKYEEDKRKSLQINISQAIPHELLTPLNGIIGLSSFLIGSSDLDAKTIQKFATGIFESGNRLHETIKKFIYYTEVELLIDNPQKSNMLQSEVVKYGNIFLIKACKLISEKHNRNADIIINSDPFNMKISLSHFEIILNNIIDNAFKFSDNGEKVKVDVTKEDELINITIQDNGIGIDENKINEITAFGQFDRDKMEQQGIGLGLITSKKLIEFYGGTFSLTKNSDKGTNVKISLIADDFDASK